MKKISVVVLALGLAVSIFGIANAGRMGGMNGMNGMGAGCGSCPQQSGAPSGAFQKFHADTIDLRQEMMTKRFEMQRENLKATPDAAKITSLQAEIKDIQSKILDIRSKSGLPVNNIDGEGGQKRGGMKGMRGCGNASGGCFGGQV